MTNKKVLSWFWLCQTMVNLDGSDLRVISRGDVFPGNTIECIFWSDPPPQTLLDSGTAKNGLPGRKDPSMRLIPFVMLLMLCLGLANCAGSDSSQTSTTGIPSGFGDLCGANGVPCETGGSAPSMIGTYSGTGTVLVTSNSLWSVGDSSAFTAVIATQSGANLTGTFEMGGIQLDVPQAAIRGTATEFTIYGTDSAEEPDASASGSCTAEARGVLTGTLSTSGTVTTITGKMELQFTNNIHGPGCTQDQITNYPGTGAIFSYTATRAPTTPLN